MVELGEKKSALIEFWGSKRQKQSLLNPAGARFVCVYVISQR